MIKEYIDYDDLPEDLKGMNAGMPTLSSCNYKDDNLNDMLFSASELVNIPNEVSYAGELGPVHMQRRGNTDDCTCYTECTTALVEWWIWKKTGERVQFSTNEIYDISTDSKGISYLNRLKRSSVLYGLPLKSLPAIYNFNNNLDKHYWTNKQESRICKIFTNLVNSHIGQFKSINISNTKDVMKRQLFYNGPCVMTFNSHAVLYVAYDESYVYYKDSYGQEVPVRMKWTAFDSCKRSAKEFVYFENYNKNFN